MQHTLNLNLAWYRRNFRDTYDTVKMVRSVLEKMDEQFPEASCPKATRLLLELLPNATLLCGAFKNKAMEKPAFHVWVFDMDAKVHIDITADQFPIKTTSKLLFFRSNDTALLEAVGYRLAPLRVWNELFDIGPYSTFPLSKMKLTYEGKETLEDVYKEVKRRLRAL